MVAQASPETQKMNNGRSNAQPNAQSAQPKEMCELKDVCDAALNGFREYAKSKPETIALWCLGIGFVLGWKLRP